MRPATVFLIAACAGAAALSACSDDEDDNGGYGGSAGIGAGGAAGSAAGSGGTAGSTPDGGGVDAAAGSAGSADDGGQEAQAGSAGSADDGGPDAAAGASWTQVYTTIISTSCSPCHTTPGGAGILNGMLDLTTQETAYSNLVNAPAAGNACAGQGTRVIPGSAETSLLYQKIKPGEPAPCGAKMPLGGQELSNDQADAIASWIQAGALND